MKRKILRGDLYFADLGGGIGSEQKGTRPVLIIQNNRGNFYSPTVIVAAVSSKTGEKARLPTHCFLETEDGLGMPSLVLLEQIRTIDKHRLRNYIGRLPERDLQDVDRALAISVGLIRICEFQE